MVRVLSLLSALALLSALDGAIATPTTTTTTTSTSGLKLYGVNYNIRAGADWEPEATKCKSAETIAQELAKLKQFTDTIRLYSLTDCDQAVKVLPAAAAAGLKVTLGLWVGPEPAVFEAEKAKLEQLLAQDGLVTAANTPAIYVGSEAMYRHDVNVTTAIANAKAIKALCARKTLNVPITIADTTEIYLKYPALLDAVDFASPNVFPFWDKIPAEKGPEQLFSKFQRLQKIAKGKDIVIGETGWPTDGVEPRGSKASMANAATYFKGFYSLAQKHALKYYYFAGFDESWKLSSAPTSSTVEAYFGLFDKTGELKDAYAALKPAATVAPTVTPTVTPSMTPTAAPTKTPGGSSAGSSAGSSIEDVDAGEPTTSTKAPTPTTASSNAPTATKAPIATSTIAPTATKAPIAAGSNAPTATKAPIAAGSNAPTATNAPVATAAGGSKGNVVIPSIGDVYIPGAVTGAKSDAISTDNKSSSGATTAPATKKPKRKDCDV